jgi:hypothetical protein
MLRVELPIRRCEQPFDDLAVLSSPVGVVSPRNRPDESR